MTAPHFHRLAVAEITPETADAKSIRFVVPDALRGRVFGADSMLATLVIAGSQVVFGLLSEVVPARELLAAAGAVVLLYAGLWFVAIRSLRHLPATA